MGDDLLDCNHQQSTFHIVHSYLVHCYKKNVDNSKNVTIKFK